MEPFNIINFWYSEAMRKHWFSSTPEIDAEIRDRYEQTWIRAAQGEYTDWMNTPDGCLALIIVLDQFPLNMYRGEAISFKTENAAVEVALLALSKGFEKKLDKDKLSFLFMPLMHSENIDHQDLSVKLFNEYNLTRHIKFAEHHRDIIRRFGRFPHRNAILGRESTKLEMEYLGSKYAFKG